MCAKRSKQFVFTRMVYRYLYSEISHYVSKNTRLLIARKPNSKNQPWLNTHGLYNDHRIKWNEATILAIDIHKFSRKMRESIEIEKHSTIDQEDKPLDSTWRALFAVAN